MGQGGNKRIKEVNVGDCTHIPEEIFLKLCNSIVRIEFDGQKKTSTGFFMKIDINNKTYNCLLTCNHSITEEDVNSYKIINILSGPSNKEKKVKLNLDKNERFIIYMEQLDVTIIEILLKDKIKDKKFLYPDLNYKNGYAQYINTHIYTGGYPNVDIYNNQRHISSGKIEKIENGIIIHNCDTRYGSSGSPLIDNNKRVIGIHYGSNKEKTKNEGTFIGNILEELNSKNLQKKNKNN